MSEKEKKVRETFGKVIPYLSDQQIDKFLTFGEGMAAMVCQPDTTGKEEPANG